MSITTLSFDELNQIAGGSGAGESGNALAGLAGAIGAAVFDPAGAAVALLGALGAGLIALDNNSTSGDTTYPVNSNAMGDVY
ncbi:hypothetical protein GTP44_16160 [Duganella sp. FT50W]|uniref:Bacteriocin n=1 Tax=Duganella lactea TaxID=2692173 RepID=A0A6L8MLG6_9BURK|nr:hypothetical protein [Duganella lactea]MYM83484.1 hypothetical protein [Duganella lactea]